MSLLAKEKSGSDIEPIPAGVYVAVCYGLIDLGTHENKVFGGDAHKVLVQWELPDVRGEFERDGRVEHQQQRGRERGSDVERRDQRIGH